MTISPKDWEELKKYTAKAGHVGADAAFSTQLIMFGELVDVLMAKNLLDKQDIANMATKWEDFSAKSEKSNPPLAHFLRMAARQFHAALTPPVNSVN